MESNLPNTDHLSTITRASCFLVVICQVFSGGSPGALPFCQSQKKEKMSSSISSTYDQHTHPSPVVSKYRHRWTATCNGSKVPVMYSTLLLLHQPQALCFTPSPPHPLCPSLTLPSTDGPACHRPCQRDSEFNVPSAPLRNPGTHFTLSPRHFFFSPPHVFCLTLEPAHGNSDYSHFSSLFLSRAALKSQGKEATTRRDTATGAATGFRSRNPLFPHVFFMSILYHV